MPKSTKRSFWQRLRAIEIRQLHKHPFVIPVITFFVLFAVSLGLYIGLNSHTVASSDAHVVILSHDNKRETIPTRAETVGDFLQRTKIDINPGDRVEPALDTAIVDDNFRVNVYRARPVTIIDGSSTVRALSAATTPRSLAEQGGVTVYPEDNITSQPTDSFLKNGIATTLVVDRATPVTLNLYGNPVTVRTHAKTVGDVLKEKQVKLAADDKVSVDLNAPVTANTAVFISRIGTQIVTQEVAIPNDVQTVDDASLSFGATAVRQPGSPGKKQVTYQVDLVNGKETGRRVIQEVVVTAPVSKIIARGRAVDIPSDKESIMAAAGISSSDYGYVSYIISRESGWCATKWQGQVGYCPGYYTELHSPSAGYGYGLCQSTPAIKMASAGADWSTNAVTQMRWCSGYANGRYGSWAAAYNHWVAYHNW